jgi:hypothetical protein|tara:strand:- start:1126 stop:1272 length:147 start_codon:yes stop_codon:yes gene_type:complete
MDLAAHRKMQIKINALEEIAVSLKETAARLEAKTCKCQDNVKKAAANG